jgi:16S rRNA (guanine1207-N2)-methyltransferase
MIADAGDIFDQVAVIGYKKGCRVARATSSGRQKDLPQWANQPGIQPGTWHELLLDTPAGQIHLNSLPGIFSFDRLDDGTQLLLAHMEVPAGSSVLDLGCGYGVIGLLAAEIGSTRVDLVDDNLLAIAASRQNALNLDKKNVSAIASDVCSELHGRSYDLVLSNPPFHSGRKVDFDSANAFIQQSAQVLSPGGRLLMVANRFIPYEEQMQTIFRKVNCVASNNRYRILQGVK